MAIFLEQLNLVKNYLSKILEKKIKKTKIIEAIDVVIK